MSDRPLTIPPVAVKLLAALVAVQVLRTILPREFDFYLVYFLGFDLFRGGAADPVWLYGAATSVFVHGGWWHLLANATWIVVLSSQIAPHLPPRRFVAFFLATGIVGALTHAALNWGQSETLIGASGAVFGLLGAGAYVLLRGQDGHSRPSLKDFGKYIVLMMAVNIGYAFIGGGGISWEAHAGGFFAGLALFPFVRRPPSRPDGLRLVQG